MTKEQWEQLMEHIAGPNTHYDAAASVGESTLIDDEQSTLDKSAD